MTCIEEYVFGALTARIGCGIKEIESNECKDKAIAEIELRALIQVLRVAEYTAAGDLCPATEKECRRIADGLSERFYKAIEE